MSNSNYLILVASNSKLNNQSIQTPTQKSFSQIHIIQSLTQFSCTFVFKIMSQLHLSLDIDPVLFVMDLDMKYTVEVVPLPTYIVWFVIM